MAKKQKPIYWDNPTMKAFFEALQRKHPNYQLTYSKLYSPIHPFGMHIAEGFIVDGVEHKMTWENLAKFA